MSASIGGAEAHLDGAGERGSVSQTSRPLESLDWSGDRLTIHPPSPPRPWLCEGG